MAPTTETQAPTQPQTQTQTKAPPSAPAAPASVRKPDAIMHEKDWRRPGHEGEDTEAHADWLQSVLGLPLHVKTSGRTVLASNCPHDCLYHQYGHPEEGTPRYDWHEVMAGCHFGVLKESAWKGDLTGNKRALFLAKAKIKLEEKRVEKVGRLAELKAIAATGKATEDQAKELAELSRWSAWVETFCKTENA